MSHRTKDAEQIASEYVCFELILVKKTIHHELLHQDLLRGVILS